MPNKYFNNMHGSNFTGTGGCPTGVKGKTMSLPGESTANWPGLPGKAQPTRLKGDRKVKVSAKDQGV